MLTNTDVLIITEVFPAGETHITGADGRALCRAVRGRGRVDPVFVDDLASLPDVLSGVLQAGDLVLTLGAGSIGAAATALPAALGRLDAGGNQ